MSWIPKAAIQFANDQVMGAEISREGSESRAAVEGVVVPIAAQVIAADPTVGAAAAARVEQELAGADVARYTDTQTPKRGRPDQHRFRDTQGSTSVLIDEDGRTHIFDAAEISGVRHSNPKNPGTRWKDRHGNISAEIDPATGQWRIYDLAANITTLATRVVHLVPAAPSQSNTLSHALPAGAGFDNPHPRILQWNFSTSKLETATTPMSTMGDAHGLSLLVVIAREIVARDPGVVVVITNTAVGDTGVVADGPNGNWAPDYAGPNPKLFQLASTHWVNSQAAIATRFPGVTVDTVIATVHGERDSTQGVTGANYTAGYDPTIAATRSALGKPQAPLVIGGMVTEWIAAESGGTFRAQVRASHVQAPARIDRSAYVDGIVGGGGSQSVTDTVHYHRAGIIELGRRMAAAIDRARANVSTSVPQTPLNVRARRAGDTVSVEWDAPICRVTDYVVTYSTDNFATSTTLTRPLALETTATITSAAPVQVRVRTVNENGQSILTRPIGA